jgi:hypothetical protein
MTRLMFRHPGSFLLVAGQEPGDIVRSFLAAHRDDC